MERGPDRKLHTADRTGGALQLYELLLRKGVAAESFGESVERLARATAAGGHERAEKAAGYLLDVLPKSSFYPAARQEREGIFLGLLDAGVSPDVAGRLTERIALCPPGEQPDDRRQACLDLVRLHPQGAEGHLDCVLTFHRPGLDLRQDSQNYRLLLEGFLQVGRPEEAASAYRFLAEGSRLGVLQGEVDELIMAYLFQLTLTDSPELARAAMAGQDGRGVGVVREGKDSVQVGGVRLPKRAPA
ncbi:MAG: hypothetical protein AB1758_07045 [Candidatus Eremiobacterota bacterium]